MLTLPEGVGVPIVVAGAELASEGVITARGGDALYQHSLHDLDAASALPMVLLPPPVAAPAKPPALIPPQVAEPLGGFTPAKPTPTSTAGELPTVNLGPLVFVPPDTQSPLAQENRNKGLEDYPGLRTGNRAKDNAAKSDPDVTSILPRDAWQAAHNIPVEKIKKNLDVFGPASKVEGGFQTDEPGNMSALPETSDAQKILADKKIIRPTHNGPHSKYSQEVQRDVDQIKAKLAEEGLKEGMDGYAQRANTLIRALENKLRASLPARSDIK